jgi:phosphate transport system substrate-binding protein
MPSLRLRNVLSLIFIGATCCLVTGMLLGCGKKKSDGQLGVTEIKEGAVVKLDGSSTVFPVSEAVAEEFQKSTEGKVKVTVGMSGTGGGFKKFVRDETDISNASRPISAEEMQQAKESGIEYIELPICFDALTVAVHPDNDWVENITFEELKKMWEPAAQGTITRWNQIRPDWPDEEIALFGAGSDSGTFDYFTEAIVGKAKSSRGDFTASEDDNVLVQGIQGNKYALGYLPYAYYEPNKNKMKALGLSAKGKEPVKPSLEAVVENRYPLSRPLFIYVNKKSVEKKPEVRAFVEFYLNNAKPLATEVNYLPLPDKAYEMGQQRLKKMQIGTGFGGKMEVELPVEEIMKRDPKS